MYSGFGLTTSEAEISAACGPGKHFDPAQFMCVSNATTGGGKAPSTVTAPPQEAAMDWTPVLVGLGVLAVVGGGMWFYSKKR
jgi:hypothetical protein